MSLPAPCRRDGWYHRLHAGLLDRGSEYYERQVGPHKERLFGSLRGRVLEIGPGAGASLAYLAPSVAWIGVEPNVHNHPHLARRASEYGLRIELHEGLADRLPVQERSIDHVISSLVLCTVPDVARVLVEIQRVLRPGGSLVFIEHVAAREPRRVRRQRLVKPLWRLMADGCEPDRDTEAALRAGPFRSVELVRFSVGVPIVGPHIAGRATVSSER